MVWILLTIIAIIAAAFLFLGLEKPFNKMAVGAVGAVWVLITIGMSVTIIEPGYRGVTKIFGEVNQETLHSGPNWVNPMADVLHFYEKRQLIDMMSSNVATAEGVRAITNDKTSIWVDIAFPYELNGDYAPWLYENIGGIKKYKKELLIPAARAAVKNAAAQFDWEEVAIKKKDKFVAEVRDQFINSVYADVENAGLESTKADTVFNFHPVQLRNVKLPDKVQDSINERMATQEDLKRQETLTKIAKEEANRRKNVGTGIASMITELPDDYEPSEMSKLLHAVADVRRAKATMLAIERGQMSWGMMTGQSAGVSVNAK